MGLEPTTACMAIVSTTRVVALFERRSGDSDYGPFARDRAND